MKRSARAPAIFSPIARYLIAVDVLFICLFFLAALTIFLGFDSDRPHAFLLEDWSFSEVYQYLKFIVVLVVLAQLSMTRSWHYAAWIPLFFYLLLDDAAQFHERYGSRLAQSQDFPAVLGMRPADLGEITIAFVSAILAGGIIVVTYLKANATVRRHFKHLGALVVLLGVFGVGVDAAHQMIPDSNWFTFVLGEVVFVALEDGGEMIMLSLILAYLVPLTTGVLPPALQHPEPIFADYSRKDSKVGSSAT